MPFNFSRAKLFLYSNLVFIGGIALASFLPNRFLLPDLWFFGAAVGCAVIIILFFLWKADKSAFILFFILFFFLGVWRYSVSLPVTGPDKIWFYNGQEIEFTGAVNREPDTREDKIKLTVEALCLEGDILKCHLPVRGNVLITTQLYPSYNYGDTLKIKCKLQAPEQIDDFYYDRYLAMQNIYSTCYNPQIVFAEMNGPSVLSLPNRIYSAILKLKSIFADAMGIGLPEPENSLLQGMILNNRGELPQELKNSFAQAGITHIIAISGMNISIISVIVINCLIAAGLSRRRALIFSAAILILYLILIGLPASAVRAGVMAFAAMTAVFFGRLNKLTNALVFAAVLMLLFNPKSLRDDIGFQLSFLALLSIIYVYPIFKEWIDSQFHPNDSKKISAKILWGTIDIIILTLAAQVLTLPVIILNFHQVSLIAPFVNVLVLFLLPFIMVAGLIAPLIGIFIPALSWLWFAPVYFPLKYMIFVADNFVKLPFAYIEIEYVWIGWVALYYFLAILLIWRYNKDNKFALQK
ncbi:MAG: competence protein ComEC family protein [Methanoregula sp.]|jgi:competence protein ComEC|nr:competence protein ComEC family protein [Methanoregula sp.]